MATGPPKMRDRRDATIDGPPKHGVRSTLDSSNPKQAIDEAYDVVLDRFVNPFGQADYEGEDLGYDRPERTEPIPDLRKPRTFGPPKMPLRSDVVDVEEKLEFGRKSNLGEFHRLRGIYRREVLVRVGLSRYVGTSISKATCAELRDSYGRLTRPRGGRSLLDDEVWDTVLSEVQSELNKKCLGRSDITTKRQHAGQIDIIETMRGLKLPIRPEIAFVWKNDPVAYKAWKDVASGDLDISLPAKSEWSPADPKFIYGIRDALGRGDLKEARRLLDIWYKESGAM